MSTSAILTHGLGSFGSSSLVLTQGLGFDVTVVTGCMVAHDIYQSGVKKAQIYNSGQKTAEVYSSGMKTGQAGC